MARMPLDPKEPAMILDGTHELIDFHSTNYMHNPQCIPKLSRLANQLLDLSLPFLMELAKEERRGAKKK
jgi:hypothetical protein